MELALNVQIYLRPNIALFAHNLEESIRAMDASMSTF